MIDSATTDYVLTLADGTSFDATLRIEECCGRRVVRVEPKDQVTLRRHWEALLSDVQAAITHRIGKGLTVGCAPMLASCPSSALKYLERAAKAALKSDD